jgi:DNA-binding MarR family transcriptional regulator
VSENDSHGTASSTAITLGLLEAVHENAEISQRSVSKRLGIALGLTNAYLKRCVKKGMIKIQQVPRKRYAYYLTPQGFAEKSRLTAEYLTSSLGFFRRARLQLGTEFATCQRRNWRRVALAGVSDFAEIASLCARDHDVEILGIVDRKANISRFAGLKVVTTLSELAPVDAVIVTALSDAQEVRNALRAEITEERIHVPPMLGIASRHAAGD